MTDTHNLSKKWSVNPILKKDYRNVAKVKFSRNEFSLRFYKHINEMTAIVTECKKLFFHS